MIVVVGDTLLDRDLLGRVSRLAPDAPVPVLDDVVEHERPGGAGLAALLAAADGQDVTLVTALAGDAGGRSLVDHLGEAGVLVVDLGLDGPTPEKVRIGPPGHPLVRIDRGPRSGGTVGPMTTAARLAVAAADAVLVADYGRGLTSEASVRATLGAQAPCCPIVWDPHLRGASPVAGVRLVTPNRAEAGLRPDASLAEVTSVARRLARAWRSAGVAVTLGERGAVLVAGEGPPLVAAPLPAPAGADPCGAGDRFAAAIAIGLARGVLPSEAVTDAVAAAAAFVAAGGVGTLRPRRSEAAATPPQEAPRREAPRREAGGPCTTEEAIAFVRSVRAAGGTVVATGGCFDLLHTGHLAVLGAARRLGDCLLVCLNDDDSVRRLKGDGRPLQPAGDRATILAALGFVDRVVTFAEDTPERLLATLRPDVWVKGGDYSAATLPEAPLLASWGGQAVVVPYLVGRSTTQLVKEATRARR